MGKKKRKHQQNCGQNEEDRGQKVEEEHNNEIKEVVLKVYIHCEGCAKKVLNCLKGFDGVEEIVMENADHKVIVKGKNLDPIKVLGRLQKKYSRNVELISPKPKPEKKNIEVQKKEEPKMKMIVLKMYMHCEGCAQDIKKHIVRMEGIMSVEPDMGKSRVAIRGSFDPPKLVQKISKRLGKHVEIVKQEFEEQDKDRNKEEKTTVYPPQYHMNYICPSSSILSDENVFACSIM